MGDAARPAEAARIETIPDITVRINQLFIAAPRSDRLLAKLVMISGVDAFDKH